MGKTLKMNTLLAITNAEAGNYKAMVKDYGRFFSGKQGAFVGERGTYEAEPNTVDDESKKKNAIVQTTVDEKLNWFKDNAGNYLNNLFTMEKSNAFGVTAELIVDGESWGTLSTLELLRLKGTLEDSNFLGMLQNIPVRSDSENWVETSAEQYGNRKVFESPLQKGQVKTTLKETYILPDPNIGKMKDAGTYQPQLGQTNKVVILGEYTKQNFSGEWSQRQRAELLKRRNLLYNSVVEALKVANEAEVDNPSKVGSQLLDYLF